MPLHVLSWINLLGDLFRNPVHVSQSWWLPVKFQHKTQKGKFVKALLCFHLLEYISHRLDHSSSRTSSLYKVFLCEQCQNAFMCKMSLLWNEKPSHLKKLSSKRWNCHLYSLFAQRQKWSLSEDLHRWFIVAEKVHSRFLFHIWDRKDKLCKCIYFRGRTSKLLQWGIALFFILLCTFVLLHATLPVWQSRGGCILSCASA